MLNIADPPKESKHSLMDGRGKISVSVTSFRALKSAQKRYDPSFFGTRRIGEDQGIAWDYYDGNNYNNNEISEDMKTTRIFQAPTILEMTGYCYFYGGVLTGPQFLSQLDNHGSLSWVSCSCDNGSGAAIEL
ncbi:Lysophospholipid acyltransferase 5 [Exaiptasia diaphana]|nr:Lysophospholipid acyltransferase 5 [Exaiptasia diaphana]